MTNFFKQAQATIVSLLFFTFLLGGVYPLLTLAIAQTAFHAQAEGSLIHDDKGQVIGSRLIGQTFSQPQYLWGRLSATGPAPYNAGASSGSNLGVNNPALIDAVKGRIDALNGPKPVPVDLVTASASGLDPEISPAAAAYQVPRIAASRHISEAAVTETIARSTKDRTFGILGEPRVNVLEVNLRLDGKLK
ncbi:potassium-transporting ATPase subunit KdpC [Asticcacaulis sp.]|uniref:potassium-transporting ATPase subunit KdpC n=1 Tax=Asticcacaulis sp. TaxID=1872648 RepID=UPI002BF8A65D|nr:potassium-transporting ATPase subunit KdpC [Asticcacaulis sp.]HTM83269.1 potassium-transporting ATPase subunit KdpC [Asticcacaulis sp.]